MDQLEDLNSNPSSSFKVPSQFQYLFDKMNGDMKFVGMFTIIYGGLICLSIIGALIGVPLIIAGMRIREAADQFSIFKTTNNTGSMRSGFELQGKYFHILKVLIIVGIVMTVIYIIFIIFFLSTFLSMFMR
jgi:type III secretory pathway component EscU